MRSQKLFEIRERVIEELKRLAKELDALVYLFGSYARGNHLTDSDVDIVVVSRIFEGLSYIDRVELVRSKLPRDLSFDILALTPEELSGMLAKSPLLREASRYWIKIDPSSD